MSTNKNQPFVVDETHSLAKQRQRAERVLCDDSADAYDVAIAAGTLLSLSEAPDCPDGADIGETIGAGVGAMPQKEG